MSDLGGAECGCLGSSPACPTGGTKVLHHKGEACSASSRHSRPILYPRIQRDLDPGQPAPIIFLAGSEAIDALFGTKGRSPLIVPNETKLAITDCAPRSISGAFWATWHVVSSTLSLLSSIMLFSRSPR